MSMIDNIIPISIALTWTPKSQFKILQSTWKNRLDFIFSGLCLDWFSLLLWFSRILQDYKFWCGWHFKAITLEFEMEVPFDEDSADGRKCITTVTMEGDNRIITNQIAQKRGQKNTKIIREFTDEGIKVQMICEGVTSIQFYTRVWRHEHSQQKFNAVNQIYPFETSFNIKYL